MNRRTSVGRTAWIALAACLGCGSAGPYQYNTASVAPLPPPYAAAGPQQTLYGPQFAYGSPYTYGTQSYGTQSVSGLPYATTFGTPYTPFPSTPWTPQPAWSQPYSPIAAYSPSSSYPPVPMLADARSHSHHFHSPYADYPPFAGLQPMPADPIATLPATSTAPIPSPTTTDITATGVPWPMPPRGSTAVQSFAGWRPGMSPDARTRARPLNVTAHPGSRCAHHYRKWSGLPGGPINSQLVTGAPATPDQDLHYRGGRVLQNLSYVNLYVSGEEGWSSSDVSNIDRSIAAAMNDPHLNNVIVQYFNNQPVTTRALASHPLRGYRPQLVTRGDIQNYVGYLSANGYFTRYDVGSTVFNFVLPPGTLLTDSDSPNGAASSKLSAMSPKAAADKDDDEHHGVIPDADEGDSKSGLGGYHGSVHVNGLTIYFTVAVYSQRLADGTAKGIPVFAEPWKNVVATLYHEMQEVRTDPDVEDAIRNASSPDASRYLGWTSNQGEEVGDLPLHDGVSLKDIIREVPLADGSGTVPIQLPYSNAVHGPEGPIPQPHPQPAR